MVLPVSPEWTRCAAARSPVGGGWQVTFIVDRLIAFPLLYVFRTEQRFADHAFRTIAERSSTSQQVVAGSERTSICGHCMLIVTRVDLPEKRVIRVASLPPLSLIGGAEWAWSLRVSSILIRLVRIESLLAWFSTLGGAHSALGDCLPEHAIHAEEVSKEQLVLAKQLGEPCLVSRCYLFLSLAFMQQEKIDQALQIIWCQSGFMKSDIATADIKLQSLYGSAVSKLRHSLRQRKKRKKMTHGGKKIHVNPKIEEGGY